MEPNERHTWLSEGLRSEFSDFLLLGSKEAKSQKSPRSIFKTYSREVCTNGDAYVYNFNLDALTSLAQKMVETFNSELDRWKRLGQPKDIESFLEINEKVMKWGRNTRRNLIRGNYASFDKRKIRTAMYRPFSKTAYFFERVFNEDLYQLSRIFPTHESENENLAICISDKGFRSPFSSCFTNSGSLPGA